jgi:hypothetical protein
MKRLFSIVVLTTAGLTVGLAACGGDDNSSGSLPTVPAATATVEISALAGPVCPVETDPPSPDCAPRPVAAAVMVVTDAAGSELVRGVTGADGTLILEVPAGELTITPQAVEGLLGTAAPITLSIADAQTVSVTADYDTGIR